MFFHIDVFSQKEKKLKCSRAKKKQSNFFFEYICNSSSNCELKLKNKELMKSKENWEKIKFLKELFKTCMFSLKSMQMYKNKL